MKVTGLTVTIRNVTPIMLVHEVMDDYPTLTLAKTIAMLREGGA